VLCKAPFPGTYFNCVFVYLFVFSGTYFNCIMMMVASSVVLTVVVLNYHHRTAETHVMPMWVRSVFLQWLPWILRMHRKGNKITLETMRQNQSLQKMEKETSISTSNGVHINDYLRSVKSRAGQTTSSLLPVQLPLFCPGQYLTPRATS
jgi:hypothetical protein